MFPSYRNQSIDLEINQLTGFYVKGTLVVYGLMFGLLKLIPYQGKCYCKNWDQVGGLGSGVGGLRWDSQNFSKKDKIFSLGRNKYDAMLHWG